jgi:hypothetical protein
MQPDVENPAGQGGAPETDHVAAAIAPEVIIASLKKREGVESRIRFSLRETLSGGMTADDLIQIVIAFRHAANDVQAAASALRLPTPPVAHDLAPDSTGLLGMIARSCEGGAS